EPGVGTTCYLDEQPDGVERAGALDLRGCRHLEAVEEERDLLLDAQQLTGGDQYREPRGDRQQSFQRLGRTFDLFEVVKHEQRPAGREDGPKGLEPAVPQQAAA